LTVTGVETKADPGSPYSQGARELTSLGYHVIPLLPPSHDSAGRGKAPGEFKGGKWWGMKDWQRFRDRPPSDFERGLWIRGYPNANMGLVLGTAAGAERVIAVDVDAEDFDQFETIATALPYSPMVKKGKKGETRFYRAPKEIKTKSYNGAEKHRLVDLLTGFDTRQTVCPPSVHPEGPTYIWTAGPVSAADLPLFGEDELERLEDTLRHLGWDPDAQRKSPSNPEGVRRNVAFTPSEEIGGDMWSEAKAKALSNLDAWVPELQLYNARQARGGYEAVATWRESSTGQALANRKRNLSIQVNGIKDFGTNETYSAIDLVMVAQGCSQEAATAWLRERLGLIEEPIFFPIAVTPDPPAKPDVTELPEHLTNVPGLVGELVDWIAGTSRRPQRGLALGAALTLVGTAAGRKYAGPTRTGTQLYVLGLARTSAGKDHALQQISRVLAASGLGQHIGPSQFMSMQAVVKRLMRTPLCLCAMDEFGAFVARINSRRGNAHEQAITGVLRTAWGCSFQTMAPPEWAGHDADPIHSPALSIYGVSTPEELYNSLEGGDVHNGFLNRFLLFSTRIRPRERDPKLDPFEVPEVIKSAMHRIYGSGSALSQATSNNGQADAPMISATWDSPEAKKVYVDFGRHVEDREREAAFLARTVEMAQRLATIRAIGIRHDAPRITVKDMEWGRDVALWSAERMMIDTSDYLSDTQNQADAQRIVRVLKENGETNHGQLVRLMQHRLKARDLKEILVGLEEAGQLVVRVGETPPGGGPKPKFYSAR
jgi:hypothetical protein